jgi:predicted TIM-barrel fold metal-dependent hydrolase
VIVDFQHHYTPRHLVEPRLRDGRATLIYTDGAPSYILHPLLWDLDEHVRMMDVAGIDAAMLSSGAAMDSADLELCRSINDDLAKNVERAYPGRFFGLGHVPALGGEAALNELRRCAGDLGIRGLVTTSYVQGQPLDDERLDPYWAEAERLGLYVFVHPALAPPGVPYMQDYDLLRSVGREFSLVLATIRLITGGVLDRFPGLKIQFGHLCGGISVLPASQIVFATDYPQEIRDPAKVKGFVDELRQLGADGAAILEGNAASLLPDLSFRAQPGISSREPSQA